MIRETISKIEARLAEASSLNEQARQELLQLLATLKREVTDLSQTHSEEAKQIAGYAETYATEAVRPQPDRQNMDSALEKLEGSVEGFETSHPKLVEIVNRLATALANLGI